MIKEIKIIPIILTDPALLFFKKSTITKVINSIKEKRIMVPVEGLVVPFF